LFKHKYQLMEQEEFLAYTIAYLENRLDAREQSILLSVLQQNAGLRKQFFHLKDIYDLSNHTAIPDADQEWQRLLGKLGKKEIPTASATAGRRPFHLWIRAAMVLITVLGVGYWLMRQAAPAMMVKTAAKGMIEKITLADGSVVTLNGSSSLMYPEQFDNDVRNVTLSGEAFFAVATDKMHPFIVHADNVTIKVLGTRFNVSAYPSAEFVATTLVEGSVSVAAAGEQTFMLSPSQQITFFKKPGAVSIREVDTALYTSWQAGTFRFNNTPLSEVLQKLSEWYGLELHYTHERLKKLRFTGALEMKKDAAYNLKLISLTASVNVKLEGKKVTVSP
jgi:ferric-dicitrate binding protein FerR (iron transport regulator)